TTALLCQVSHRLNISVQHIGSSLLVRSLDLSLCPEEETDAPRLAPSVVAGGPALSDRGSRRRQSARSHSRFGRAADAVSEPAADDRQMDRVFENGRSEAGAAGRPNEV